ncbi:MAG: EamA family transporter [Candidatus Latescibacteria bacterium]|nr:EamA family transporter [Candidatus Latescibacterota bacterium]
MRNDRLTLKAGALALLAALLWGGNSVSIKLGLDGVPPAAMAGLRFLLGLIVVGGAALYWGIGVRIPRRQWAGLGGLAVLFIAQILTLNIGTDFTSGSRSTIAISTYPFFTALAAHLFIPGDRLSPGKVAGMLLAFAGVLLLFAEGLFSDAGGLLGDAIVLASAVMLGLRQIVLKRLVQGLHTFQVLFWQAALSLPVFALISLLSEADQPYTWTWSVTAAVLYQGLVVAGFCFILWVSLLQRYSASRLGVVGFATPVLGVLLSALLLGDPLTWGLLGSMGLVALGIAVVNRESG